SIPMPCVAVVLQQPLSCMRRAFLCTMAGAISASIDLLIKKFATSAKIMQYMTNLYFCDVLVVGHDARFDGWSI
ncbi:MAG: hypothetical protein J5861_07065, partial [Desulfovibrio sp.]|nr:hypothetical protein [Desulfovibrio sp.]